MYSRKAIIFKKCFFLYQKICLQKNKNFYLIKISYLAYFHYSHCQFNLFLKQNLSLSKIKCQSFLFLILFNKTFLFK